MDRPGSGIRSLTGLLLALNLGVLALGVAVVLWPGADRGGESFNSEKIRLLGLAAPDKPADPPPVPPVPEPVPVPAEPTAAPIPVAPRDAGKKVEKAAEAVPEKPAAPACLTWKTFEQRHYDKLVALMGKRGVKEGGFEILLDKPLGWWVHTAPYPDLEAAQAALKDVQARKVKSALVIKTGELKNALSLGAFPDRRRAQEHIKALTARGVKGALYGPRRIEQAGLLRLKSPAEAKVWAELARELEAVVKTEPECASRN